MVTSALLVALALTTSPAIEGSGIKVGDTPRQATLLQGTALESDYRPAQHSMLRLMDDVGFLRGPSPAPLDSGGGMSSDLRQILALILGFIPGFGLGHLIARDRDGFILFLVIDLVLWAVGGFLGYVVFRGGLFFGLGGLVWLVVHIIQALDAYGSAGGERLVQRLRENAIEIASVPGRVFEPLVTLQQFKYTF